MPRPTRLPRLLAAGALAGAATAAYATLVEPYRPRFRRAWVEVPPTWPPLDVLHLSDLHLRRSDPRLVRAQRQALARLPAQPDLVVVTGDLCEQLEDAELVVELLRLLRPPLGSYLVLGNHEYYALPPQRLRYGFGGTLWWAFKALFPTQHSAGPCEADAIARALEAAGLRVLRNEGVRLEHRGRRLWLAGVDSVWAGRADPSAALCGRRPDEGALALIHEPGAAIPSVEAGADLVLAGHTHGGQVRLPLIGAPYFHQVDPRVPIPAGFQALGERGVLLHLSAGFGQLVPLRFNCPPEYVWLSCRPAQPPYSARYCR